MCNGIKIRKIILQNKAKEVLSIFKDFENYQKEELEILIEEINVVEIPSVLNHLYKTFDPKENCTEKEKEEIFHSVNSFHNLISDLRDKLVAKYSHDILLPQDFALPYKKSIHWTYMEGQ